MVERSGRCFAVACSRSSSMLADDSVAAAMCCQMPAMLARRRRCFRRTALLLGAGLQAEALCAAAAERGCRAMLLVLSPSLRSRRGRRLGEAERLLIVLQRFTRL